MKQILSHFFMLVALLIFIPLAATEVNAEYNLITDRSMVDGSDYTASPEMAEILNAIFDGNASIYADKSCTVPVDTLLGTSPVKNNGVSMHVGPEGGDYLNKGTSCYIYANGVYYTLFGEVTGGGEAGENSEMLKLTGSRRASYENFKAWGVRQGVGALIRGSGHSMILLDYDEDSITILDGNSDGRGRVSICTRSWEKFADYYYISYIIQPKDAYYATLYDCGMCGEGVNWHVDSEGTLTISGEGVLSYPGWINYSSRIRRVIIGEGVTGIRSAVFQGCSQLEEIVFSGSAPAINNAAFSNISATAWYPATSRGWAENVLLPYGGNLTWMPYGVTQLKITDDPTITFSRAGTTAVVSLGTEGDGLTYNWYTKDPDSAVYVKSSVTGAAYTMKVSQQTRDRQILCVVTDQYGNQVKSENVLLSMDDSGKNLSGRHAVSDPDLFEFSYFH